MRVNGMVASKKRTKRMESDSGITSLLEFVFATKILLVLFILMIFVSHAVFIEHPANTLKWHSYIDIGNGISARIVDLYLVAPQNGTISSKFDIPDDVVGYDYYVDVFGSETDQKIEVTDGRLRSKISLAGIGATREVTGQTTGRGLNVITYNSSGVG
jgi:hypothetical protein